MNDLDKRPMYVVCYAYLVKKIKINLVAVRIFRDY